MEVDAYSAPAHLNLLTGTVVLTGNLVYGLMPIQKLLVESVQKLLHNLERVCSNVMSLLQQMRQFCNFCS